MISISDTFKEDGYVVLPNLLNNLEVKILSENIHKLHPNNIIEPMKWNIKDGVSRHKMFWWYNHLGIENVGGGTGIGPALQKSRDVIEAMPTHPAPTVGPGTPTPPTPYQDITGKRYVVLLTDGRPNH